MRGIARCYFFHQAASSLRAGREKVPPRMTQLQALNAPGGATVRAAVLMERSFPFFIAFPLIAREKSR